MQESSTVFLIFAEEKRKLINFKALPSFLSFIFFNISRELHIFIYIYLFFGFQEVRRVKLLDFFLFCSSHENAYGPQNSRCCLSFHYSELMVGSSKKFEQMLCYNFNAKTDATKQIICFTLIEIFSKLLPAFRSKNTL